MVWDVVLGGVIVFVVIWAAVYSGTKMALQSFFGQQHVDLNALEKPRDGTGVETETGEHDEQ
ncbi:hypothetical protein OB955_00480 [Halobacteria archaeon AArc-m2/3/4]|uniref:Uncharacterized protein n=1 Tax=Natronoglomus mannanivorans TaxID=2979990 RepID=A0AAP2YZA3_9EURY|nr:hypothetical protein [Halobacteria archaeon AArc-xg1-1]MCU4971214.1 hypothetical protein [Halobacteria archaeon AArc-m2/3/4]